MRNLSTSEKIPSLQAPRFFVAGVDLGQKLDHSAIAVVEKRGKEFYLVLLKQFPLGTEYGSVLGYLKLLNENLRDLRRIMIDQTGVGETFMSMVNNSGLKNARGINLSQPTKQDIMTFLKHCMEDGLIHIPYDREFMNDLNVERFELQETGKLKYSHPPGTHDDRLWAFALEIYYGRYDPPGYHPVAAVNKYPSPGHMFPPFSRSPWKR